MGCSQSTQGVSETQKNGPDNQARAQVSLAPSASDETEKEQGATATSHAWLEQLAINLSKVDEEEQRIQRENYLRSPSFSETMRAHMTAIFQLANLLKPVSKEDYEGKWFSRLLTDHTFKVKYDERFAFGISVVSYINAVGLQGVIPDRAQVSIICYDYQPSVVSVVTGRVRNDRLWKCTEYEFGSHLWKEQGNRSEFKDYRVYSLQLSSIPQLAPSPTWDQVQYHIKKNWENRKFEIVRHSSRNLKQFCFRKVQENTDLILWYINGKNFHFQTEVHYFGHKKGSEFKQESVFLMRARRRSKELGHIFEW